MINHLNHYSLTNPASIYDEEALTALELAARCAKKVNDCVDEYNRFETSTNKNIEQFNKRMDGQDKRIDQLFEVELPEHIENNVNDWLDKHPEATTSVLDHSLTMDKMVIGTLGYVTPQNFGAVADGATDDSGAFQSAIDSGAKYLFIPEGTYRLETPVNIPSNTKICVRGAGVDVTTLNTANGCFNAGAHTFFAIGDMTICGDAGTRNGYGIKGDFSFSLFENLRIYQVDTCIFTEENTWINLFKNCYLGYANYGFKASNHFNNNSFYACRVQNCTTGIYLPSRHHQNNFDGCDIELCKVGFELSSASNFVVNNSYIEGNDVAFKFIDPVFNSDYTVTNCYVYANQKTGWLAQIPSVESRDVNPAILRFENCRFSNFDSNKGVTFYGDYTNAHLAVCFNNNIFQGGVETYGDVVDRGVCTNYGNTVNFLPIQSDLPIYKNDNCKWYVEHDGNTYLYGRTYRRVTASGTIAIEQTGKSLITIPVDGYVGNYPMKTASGFVEIVYGDGTRTMTNADFDASNMYVRNVDPTKTTSMVSLFISY